MKGFESGDKRVHINSDFLYLKILGQPKFFKAWEKEIEDICRTDAGFCGKIGADWDDASFERVADIAMKTCMRNAQCTKFAESNWKPDRYGRLADMNKGLVGRLSIAGESGRLSLAEDQEGRLSLAPEERRSERDSR